MLITRLIGFCGLVTAKCFLISRVFILEQSMNNLYILCDPETDKIYYVGQTDCPDRRFREHCNQPGNIRSNPFLAEWLLQLRERGLQPKMTIIEKTYIKVIANQREQELIKEYWDNGHPIMNKHQYVASVYQQRERLYAKK